MRPIPFPMQSPFPFLLLLLAMPASACAQDISFTRIADGVHVLVDPTRPGRGPDGNSVLFETDGRLVVVDTGRHAWHSDQIIARSSELGAGIGVVFNTHWHLDHSSGNGRIRQRFPDVRVHASSAVERALAPGGFLARDHARFADPAAREGFTPVQQEEIGIFLATMQEPDVLRPDVAIDSTREMELDGRTLTVHVARHAVTDADLWLYDHASGVVVLGDLVTLPIPFMETACPSQWSAALDAVWSTPFTHAVPGHGRVLDRAGFDRYRQGFNAFVACAGSDRPAAECSRDWQETTGALYAGDEGQRAYAEQGALYYVDFLRRNGGASPDCLVKER